MRALEFIPHFTEYAAGSVLVAMGRTRVICTAMVEDTVPRFLANSGTGWVTAEYDMLPAATRTRNARDARRGGGVKGRTSEIQRLIGRSLRAGIDLKALGERSIYIDCDVLQADGGTRTASVNGGYVALALACRSLLKSGQIDRDPITTCIAAVSVGIVKGRICVDLDYENDSTAEVDMNVVMNDKGELVEIQGTAERKPFSRGRLQAMLKEAAAAVGTIVKAQKKVIAAHA